MKELKGGCGTKFGGDPEFFVVEKESGRIISSDKFFPSKDEKLPVALDLKAFKPSSFGERSVGSLHFDGVQAEINFRPGACREYVQDDIWRCLKKANEIIGEKHILSSVPSVVMSLKDLRAADPEARRFGCNPDWNAYTREQNLCELDGNTHRTRYGGGHIHVSFNDYTGKMLQDKESHLELIKLMDIVVGIPTTMLDQSFEAKRRRKAYGGAGCFRPTAYGIEYRTPSNFWLLSPALTSLVLGLTRLSYAIWTGKAGKDYLDRVSEEEVQSAINSNSLTKSIKVYNKVRDMLLFHGNCSTKHLSSVSTSTYGDWKYSIGKPYMFEFVVNYGMLNLFGGYDNIETNWKLSTPIDKLVTHGGTAKGWHYTMIEKISEDKSLREAVAAYKEKFRFDGDFQRMTF